MVSRQSPDKRAVGCTGALLSFGYYCVEVCPKGGDVGLDLAGLDVGEDKAQGVAAALDVADGFPMHTDQFGQTFLRQITAQPRFTNALANKPQNLFVCHGG